MMPEAVNLSGEQHGRIDQSAGNRADERDHLVVTEVIRHHELPVSVFDARGPKTAREAISDLVFKIVRLGHPEADPNRSGSEGQGPLGGEPAPEFRENRQVGVELDSTKPTDAQREQRPLVLEPCRTRALPPTGCVKGP